MKLRNGTLPRSMALQHWYGIIAWSVLLFTSCASPRASQTLLTRKYAPAALKEDMVLLKKILEANHPSLYWYTPKDSLDAGFAAIAGSITDSLTEVQFRNKVAAFISQIRCGHTAVRFSNAYTRAAIHTERPQFPLFIKTWGDSMVVLGSAFRRDSIFKRGTIITGINQMSNRQLLDSMFRLISTDGYADNFKSQVISMNFPVYFRNTFGLSDRYTIRYIDSSGQEKTAELGNYDARTDTVRRSVTVNHTPPLTRKELRQAELASKRSLQLDTARQTAYMRLTTFSEGRLRDFFSRSFRQLKKNHIQNLVIDLRENGGGSIAVSTLLTRYLVQHPFKIADTISAASRRFRYGRYIHPSWVYWLSMRFTSHKESDGRFHFGRYERHVFHPVKNNHFDGNIYLLQGGYTFSAATMFIANLKGEKNVTVLGEETGGGSYGNSSVHLPTIKLPHSGLKIILPMYRIVLNRNNSKTGRGIVPDIPVYPSSIAIRRGADVKMEQVQALISAGNRQESHTGSTLR